MRDAWALFAIALALRLGYVLFYPQLPLGSHDAFAYDHFAWNLASGKGFVGPLLHTPPGSPDFPQASIGPIYPGFLALIYLVFGHSLVPVRVAQALLGALIIVVLYGTVRDAFGREIARRAGVLIALYPALIVNTGVVLTETLTAFLLSVVVWTLARAVRSEAIWPWGTAGVTMGMTILHRQETLALVPVFAALIVWRFRPRPPGPRVALFAVIAILTVGVWTVRNYVVFRTFIPVTYRGGETLWISTKGWMEWRTDDPEFQSLVRGVKYYEQDKPFRRAALRNIASDPVRYLILSVKRIPQMWVGSHSTVVGLSRSFRDYYTSGYYARVAAKAALLLANTLLVLAGVWGLVVALRATGGAQSLPALLAAPIIVIAVLHFFLYATQRYAVPVMPFVLVFAAVAFGRWGVLSERMVSWSSR